MKPVLLLSGIMAFAIPLDAYSQPDDAVENYKLQIRSPQLSDMIRFDRFGSIDENSGRLDLSVDLIHWEDPDFDMPVRLKYNSEGFKPNTVENYVGRDWFLICGGVIYREINGIADDHRYAMQFVMDGSGSHQYGFLGVKSKGLDRARTERRLYEDPQRAILAYPESRLPVFDSDRSQEVSSDTYYFRFGKYSGKFMIDFDGTVSAVCYSGGKCEVDISDYRIQIMGDRANDYESEIRIRTDDGYTYCFGGSYDAVEYMSYAWDDQHRLSMSGPHSKHMQSNKVVAWGLRKIIAPNQRVLTVRYLHLPPEYCNNPWELLCSRDEFADCGYNRCFSVQCSPYCRTDYRRTLGVASQCWLDTEGSFGLNEGCDYMLNKLMLIEEIETDDKQLKFTYSDRRESLFESGVNLTEFASRCGAQLDAVTLTGNGGRIERSELTYRYVSKRLFLVRVSNSKTGTYQFAYDTGTNGLPRIDTRSVDHWGYYRYIPNEAFVPDLGNYSDLRLRHRVAYRGADRAPLFNDLVSLGMLTEVTFPTGGALEIEYEPHTYSSMLVQELETEFLPVVEELPETRMAGGLRVRSLKYVTDGKETNRVYYKYDKGPQSSASSGMLMYMPRYYHFNRTLSWISFNVFNFPIVDAGGYNRRDYASEHVRYSTITRFDVGAYSASPDSVFMCSVSPLEACEEPVSYPVRVGVRNPGVPGWADIERAYAKWTIAGNASPDGTGYATAEIRQGGRTIREFRFDTYDPDNRVVFNPTDELEPGIYILTLYKTGNAWVSFRADYPRSGRVEMECDGYVVSEYSDYRTNPDLYTDEDVFLTTTYFKMSSYTQKPELDTLFFRNYFRKPESRAIERGKLLSRTVYDHAGTPLQRTTYRYATPGFDRYCVFVATRAPVNSVSLDMYSHLHRERMYACLPSETTTTYYAGADSLTSVEYTDYDRYGYPLSVRAVNSDGTERVVTTERVLHVPDDTPTYRMMEQQNMVGALRRQEERMKRGENSRLLKRTMFEYGVFDDMVWPACSRIVESVGEEDRERIRYLAYDCYGNPLHTVEDETLHTVYIWSYLGKYPIARIEHATLDEVSAALGAPVVDWSFRAVPDMTRIERLRSALPAARVWTYTYRPLFGMTSATDPAGQTTRYGYDSAGRLTHTSIDGPGGEQQLIEYNEYHIVNP